MSYVGNGWLGFVIILVPLCPGFWPSLTASSFAGYYSSTAKFAGYCSYSCDGCAQIRLNTELMIRDLSKSGAGCRWPSPS